MINIKPVSLSSVFKKNISWNDSLKIFYHYYVCLEDSTRAPYERAKTVLQTYSLAKFENRVME